jgi:hypothetical protein
MAVTTLITSATPGVVRAESLTKRFGGVVAVDDLSFALEEGTITAWGASTRSGEQRGRLSPR